MTAYLILAAAILVVHLADVLYTVWAMKKYGLSESNRIWKAMSKYPRDFVLDSTGLMALALVGLYLLRSPAWPLGFGLAARIVVLIRNFNIVAQKKREAHRG